MNGTDDWARDPGVRRLREVFAAVEQTGDALLAAWSIEPFDAGLRRRRERALQVFQQAWGLAAQSGRAVGPDEAAWLYARSLQAVLAKEGHAADQDPDDLLGPAWALDLVKEVGP